jgi:hypothetical protein
MKIINDSTFFGENGQRAEVLIYDGDEGEKYQVVKLYNDVRFGEDWFTDLNTATDFAEDFILKTPIVQ